ncbi:lamin tail domain-containing protein [Melioribacter sp. Ez-97]|uniref:lamin tail domain-containing protein n=1 Tax=Melioribacter sp. Ez-97 TaxID=3423434 RepID=UPI003EDB565A
MKQWKKLIVFLFPVVTNLTAQNLIISEIMFRPSESNGEFIELFNKSYTESYDLTDFGIKYHTSPADFLISYKNGSLLRPRSYAVILEGDYDFDAGGYMKLIPDTVIVMTIDDNAFGSSGMSNSSDREVSIVDKNGSLIDSHIYSADNPAGYSDELISVDENLGWSNSLTTGGTPGRKNSVSPTDYDLCLCSLSLSHYDQMVNKNIVFTIIVRNNGLKESNEFILKVLSVSSGLDTTEIFKETYSNLNPGDSMNIRFDYSFTEAGAYDIAALIINDYDEANSNNSAHAGITIFEPEANYNDIVINEIMYAPENEEPEWVEIYNRTHDTLNIKDWQIADSKSSVVITDADFYLLPESYIVITGDSLLKEFYQHEFDMLITKLPYLNNGGDEIILKDNYQNVIDSLYYGEEIIGVNGKSLERINAGISSNQPDNWGATKSKSDGTPGAINSLSPKEYDVKLDTVIVKNPFQLINNPSEITVMAKNVGNSAIDKCVIELYNGNNEKIGECILQFLQANEDGTCSFEIVENEAGRHEYYCVVFSETDQFHDNDTLFFTIDYVNKLLNGNDIVINEIMYAPNPPEPEWIEIFVNASEEINLKKMKLVVGDKRFELSAADYLINPGDYLLVSNDSSIAGIYTDVKIIFTDFSYLRNSGDKLKLVDSLGRTIDSVFYSSAWGGRTGKSLERIDAYRSGSDSLNWAESKEAGGSTPGKKNSNAIKNYDVKIDSVNIMPKHPVAGEKMGLTIYLSNAGREPLEGNLIIYTISNGAKEKIKSEYLIVYDTKVIKYDSLIRISKPVDLEILFHSALDEDTTNNSYCAGIIPGCVPGSLLVNEIMFYPADEMPEWIELYNNSDSIIYLNEFTVNDRYTNITVIKIDGSFVNPRDYLIIASDSSFYEYYREAHVAVTGLPVLNNDSDAVVIKDVRGLTIDSVFYHPSGVKKAGVSYERRSVELASNDSLNWKFSRDSSGATPGRKNSVCLNRRDLAAGKVFFDKVYAKSDDLVRICCDVINKGTGNANNFIVEIYASKNGAYELLERFVYDFLPPFDTVTVCTEGKYLAKDNSDLLVKIIYLYDEDITDNERKTKLTFGYTKGAIVVNEIMYNPNENEPEWIEIFNATDKEINLKDWTASDVIPEPGRKITINEDVFIAPSRYLVLCSEGLKNYPEGATLIPEFLLLNNSEDGVVIYDSYGNYIDSLYYKSGRSDKKGVSLEKISPYADGADSANWSLSLSPSGSTPLKENSIVNLPAIENRRIIINEILYEPAEGNSEFIELFNNSDGNLQIGGLSIEGHNDFRFVNELTVVSPREYFLLANDSALIDYYGTEAKLFVDKSFSLPNEGAVIKLVDFYGNLIDSLRYSRDWHSPLINNAKNKSLERINFSIPSTDENNWSTSADASGATPGRQNSIYTSESEAGEEVTVFPNPFSPDNDGYEDFTTITIKLNKKIGLVRIRIFDSKGRPVRTLEKSRPAGPETVIVYDGLDDNSKPLRTGIYILLIEAIDENGSSAVFKKPLVSARKL